MKTEQFIESEFKSHFEDSLQQVLAIFPIENMGLLIGTVSDLFFWNENEKQLQKLKFENTAIEGICAIIKIKNEIWAGGITGVFKLKFDENSNNFQVLENLKPIPSSTENLLANAVSSLFYDEYSKLWIGTLEGCFRVDTEKETLEFEDISDHFSDTRVHDFLTPEPGLLWVGTREGINHFSYQPPIFNNLNQENAAFCSDVLFGMAEDENGKFWLGTKEGLTKMASLNKAENAHCLTPQNTPRMGSVNIINVKNLGSEIWATFWKGGAAKLVKTDKNSWEFEHIPNLKKLTNDAGIHDLVKDKEANIWIATPNLGIVRWNEKDQTLKTFSPNPADSLSISSPYIFHLLIDKKGQLWAGTANGGLCKMNPKSGTFDCFIHDPNNTKSLSNNMVLSTFEDSQNRLWISTANGLNLMETTGVFRRFSKNDGLPNEVIYGMLEDDEQQLWLSTNGGLCKMTFENNQLNIQNFEEADGLQGNEFNQYAFLKTSDGQLLFGGTKGLTYFHPKNIQPFSHLPNTVFTDFQLFNQSVKIGGEENFSLTKSINETEKITLKHFQNFIAFEFAGLTYTQTQGNQYAYQMVGLDENWVFSGNRRFASYPNLLPGEYTFRVKAANHDGIWNENYKSIKIGVLPPWWQTWWAYLLYAFALIAAIILVIRLRENSIRNLEKAKAEEREYFRKRTARDFHDEAGNRITKLALLTEVVKRQIGSENNLITQIEENIQALRSGMRDFIWVLDPENDSLQDLFLRLRDFGNSLFEHSETRFNTANWNKNLNTFSLNGNQRRHLLLIFKEAMNNVVKYAQASEAKFSIEKENEFLKISLKDNGQGFDLENISGNGLKNIRARAEKMGAVAEIYSKRGEGTKVSILIKIYQ